ncbi:beta-lactamase-like protein [Bombardia bombarda]|uniref:Beta-lactamase-like protein n=1 Tax=Bombardia bombarda TaxID=252184 RepID=A0AA40CAU5_9PEZI|nr:beta-lactamase-like protein [Bombardia bombarda]
MPSPTFATPLPQSSRSDILEWRFPKPFHNYVLTGKSRAAWHTSFVIPQLNLLLDAGLCVNKLRPKHIFLTHGHSDHTLSTPDFVKKDDPPDIYCPAEMKAMLDDYVWAHRMLNRGGLAPDEAGGPSHVRCPDDPPKTLLNTHVTHGLSPGDQVPLRRCKNITATAFHCDHTLPCLGYVFSTTTHKLKPEYQARSGPEIKALRQSGQEITAPATSPIFAFLGDTTAATLAAGPEWLTQGIPIVITECSFLREEHRAQAEKTKHTIWADLEVVARSYPKTTFVITHFSLRYSNDEVRSFFADMADPPGNIVVWIDGQGEE